jgi:hypothetical protein
LKKTNPSDLQSLEVHLMMREMALKEGNRLRGLPSLILPVRLLCQASKTTLMAVECVGTAGIIPHRMCGLFSKRDGQ